MKQIPIASLERFADIKAHTFRAWEQRYNFSKPHRTKTNQRYYTISQLGELLNIALLKKTGYKISQLDKLGSGTIKRIVEELRDDECRKTRQINLMIVSMYSENIEEFEDILDKCVYYWGIDSTIEDIVMPFLNLVRLGSYRDTSNEVHFAVTALRKKIISGIENTKSVSGVKKALFFLPQHEHFDLILLYMSYIAKRAGYVTLYMGTNVPTKNLQHVITQKRPDLVVTYLTQKGRFSIQHFSQFLAETVPDSSCIVSGFIRAAGSSAESNITFLAHQEIDQHLKEFILKA